MDKLKHGKIFIGKKSVQVSALEECEEGDFLPKPQNDTHYFWKSCMKPIYIKKIIYKFNIFNIRISSGNCESKGAAAQLQLSWFKLPLRAWSLQRSQGVAINPKVIYNYTAEEQRFIGLPPKKQWQYQILYKGTTDF